jgi:glycosyltransferase involved in cell wall biosynthesis
MPIMRIALISPYSRGPARGNITTVNRIARFLGQAGASTLVLAADCRSVDEMEQCLAGFCPDVIHGFHARYCGAITRHLAERRKVPYIITITGSDIHDPQLGAHPETATAISSAQAMVCFDDRDAVMLAEWFPHTGGRIAVVPQGVEPLPVVAVESFGLADDAFVVVLPAALRPVKQVDFPLRELAPLMHQIPSLHLVIAGGVIDQDYAASIRGLLCAAPFATWLGEVPHERMGSLYARADLALNCSRSESMPNSLMEAMALGRPVLAADIPGNRSLVCHEETGWLYRDESDFRELVVRIAGDAFLRAEFGRRGQEHVLAKHAPQLEAGRLLALYRSLSRTDAPLDKPLSGMLF